MIRNNLDNPIFLMLVLLMAITINAITSIHFLLVMFAGILFTAFYRTLRKRYLYSLTFVVIAFLFIEINSGLKPFSLSLLSLFIYVFILPKVEDSNSYNYSNSYFYILIYYISLCILWSLTYQFDPNVIFIFFVNLIIDIIFFGVFL